MPTYAVTIAGASKQIQEGWTLRETVNGRNVLSFGVRSGDGTYRPALNAAVVLIEDAVTIYGGNIDRPSERGFAGHGGTAMETSCSAVDFNALADRRIINAIIPSQSLKATLQAIEPFLTPYGVALDAAQATGPTLPALAWTFLRVDKILDQLSELSGYIWEIDYTKTLRMFLPSSTPAPFNVVDGDGNATGDVVVEPSRNEYANSVWIVGGGSTPYVTQLDDGGSSANLVEAVFQYPDIFDSAVLDALAIKVLAKVSAQPRTVTYTTRRTGLKPGMTQALTIPSHSISAVTFMITAIETRSIAYNLVERTVTLLEGSANGPSWRDVYRQWGGSSGASSGMVVFGSGGVDGPAFLGGSRNTSVALASAAYTPVTDYVPFVAKTTFTGQVRADIWARDAGITATVRLRNVTDSTTAGTSSGVTSTTPTEVTFTVSITVGKTYRLEVLSSANSKGVFAIGALESV